MIYAVIDTVSFFSRKSILEGLDNLFSGLPLSDNQLIYLRTFVLLIAANIVFFVLWWATRKILIRAIHVFADLSKTKWDDYLVKNKFFAALAHLVPFLFIEPMVRTVFADFNMMRDFVLRLTDVVIVVILLYCILRFLNTLKDILEEKPRFKDKPIASYVQLSRIVVTILLGIVMISIAFQINPIVIITSMGAATAIILLVFKDTILGFVGSIQLAANDMVRIGDWITMEKYGADGDVVEITLATVKVQNFDKTITTIPTYSFISDSFQNWRGMLDSDGRRLMRSINIKMQSIKFCTPEMLAKFGEVEIIKDYIHTKEEEVKEFNKERNVNKQVLLNGKNQTNIGVFRYYITKYLEQNEDINTSMTLMVRQLQPTEKGVPLQLYAFTKSQEWEVYEANVADVFDHILSSVQYFELELFENPTGSDMRSLKDFK
ncbi:mechanosensitive ion channel family protein [Crocinitomix catalasitica]|uniref:mechanosensitive ion channel family protein n=1 Tax=Crocinitomix catalasitica TaxID=184607 RepID=UPI000688B20E|nr:mechanosensitive ion channel domain-containing protein [Crocinitomix catalasitica]